MEHKTDGGFEGRPFAEVAKEDVFKGLRDTVEDMLATGNYDGAKEEMKKELTLLADALGGLRSERLREIWKEFEGSLSPELLQALNPESREKYAQAPQGRSPSHEQKREIIRPEEIIPGLMIVVENLGSREQRVYEIVGNPRSGEDGDIIAEMRRPDSPKTQFRSLCVLGLLPFADGRWSNTNRIVTWRQMV